MVASSSPPASFAKAIRVKQFPPMIVVDVPIFLEAWKQKRNSVQEKWMEQNQQRIKTKKQPAVCTNNNYVIPVILPSSLLSSKQNDKEEALAPSWKNTSSAFVGSPFLYFLLGALVAHWFQSRRKRSSSSAPSSDESAQHTAPTITQNLEPELSAMQQKMVEFEQRVELVETHQKIDRLERQLFEQDRGGQTSHKKKISHHDHSTTTSLSTTTQPHLPTREVQWTSVAAAAPMMLSPSSSSTMVSEEEEARMHDRMLRTVCPGHGNDEDVSITSRDGEDVGTSNAQEDAEEVGVLLQDFQSELEHIQETLRTGNYP